VVDTATLVVDAANHRVGINNTAPSFLLHAVHESLNNQVAVRIAVNSTAGATYLAEKSRGTAAVPLRVQSGDVVGGMNAQGAHAVDNTTTATFSGTNIGQFVWQSTESFTASAMGTHLLLRTTATGSTTVATRVLINTTGLTLGTAAVARGTTDPTNALNIFDGTAPVGTLTNGCTFYSTAGEMRVMDAAGNATLLSPHDPVTNEWIYHSVHSVTGKHLRIDMERLMRALDASLGGGFITEGHA
jgi:hypothetical protein